MAASAMIGVGNVDAIIDQICEEARKIIPGENLGAVINKESKERIERYIGEAERDGADRSARHPGAERDGAGRSARHPGAKRGGDRRSA